MGVAAPLSKSLRFKQPLHPRPSAQKVMRLRRQHLPLMVGTCPARLSMAEDSILEEEVVLFLGSAVVEVSFLMVIAVEEPPAAVSEDEGEDPSLLLCHPKNFPKVCILDYLLNTVVLLAWVCNVDSSNASFFYSLGS